MNIVCYKLKLYCMEVKYISGHEEWLSPLKIEEETTKCQR